MGRNQGGTSLPRRLVALVVLVAIGYVAAVTIPVVVTTFRFSQAIGNEVLHGPENEAAGVVQRRLAAAADRLGLDVPFERIIVRKSGARYEIDADYVVPVEFIGGVTFDWRFSPHKEGTRRPAASR